MNKFYSRVIKRLVVLVILLVCSRIAAYAVECPTCQTSFGAPRQLLAASGGQIQEVGSGDFNGDSNSDLVALNVTTNQVLFLAGDGAGNFASPVASSIALSSLSRSLTIAHLNDDDNLDLAITNFTANTVSILLGNGAGSFTVHATLNVAPSPDRMAVADFNNDSKQDLLVLSRGVCSPQLMTCGTTTVTEFFGNGAGDFALAGSFTAGTARSTDIGAADFNGDGKIDLAMLGEAQPNLFPLLLVRFGDGTGNFSDPATSLDRHLHFTIGDFNGDGKPDLAASSIDKIRIYLANGQGGFTSVDSPNFADLNSTLSVADFNTDGKLDVLLNNPSVANNGTTFSGYAPLGDGQGKLQLPAPIGEGVKGDFVATGDFNKDGKPDLAVSNGNLVTMLNETDCSQPIVCVLDGDVSVTEGNLLERTVDVTVKLSSPSSNPITVDFATEEFEEPFHNSAQSGIDFKPVSGTLTFDPSSTTRTVTITIFGDMTFELDEPFLVALRGATGAKLVRLPFSAKPSLVRILNDDPRPASDPVPHVQVSDATIIEGNAGTKQAIFTVTLSAPQSDYRNVIHRTADISAQSGTDYQGISPISPRDLWFAPGDTTRTIAITIFGDTMIEGNESFLVELIPQQTLIFDRSSGVGTILDDDSPVNPAAPVLITEEGSPKAIALDALLHTIGPFSLVNNNYFVSDKRTRVSLFVRNVSFSTGEDPLSALNVTIRDVDPNANPNTHVATLEFVRALAGTDDVTQIIVRLPDDITPLGDKLVILNLHGLPSNQAVIVLKPTP